MRIYTTLGQMAREVERDLWEMGINVHPETMQDKRVKDDPDYMTKELRGYGFKVVSPTPGQVPELINYMVPDLTERHAVLAYCQVEFNDRTAGVALNPGNSYLRRPHVWAEFLHEGRFSYTYSERMTPQLKRVIALLHENPNTRQAIINLHSNVNTSPNVTVGPNEATLSADGLNTGGHGRIPCSMYYQLKIREGKLDLDYTMRSCDFLTHFPIDIALAVGLMNYVCFELNQKSVLISPGVLTYFTGSLHAYSKDMKRRGIF